MTADRPTLRPATGRLALALTLLAALPAALRAAPPEPAEEARRKRGEVKITERVPSESPVHALVLAAELAGPVHALQLRTLAPGEA